MHPSTAMLKRNRVRRDFMTVSAASRERAVGAGSSSPYISHAFVVGAASAFGRDPVDDLVGVGDVAGFAMDAIGGVDFQFGGAFLGDHFVDRGGTKILAGVAVFADAAI